MKPPGSRSTHPAIEALNAAVEDPGPLRRMSEKRKFLIENFQTIQKARTRKPRPLSYTKIAKILSAHGVKVSAQLVVAVCKEYGVTESQEGVAALDSAATRRDKGQEHHRSAVVREDPTSTQFRRKPIPRKNRNKSPK